MDLALSSGTEFVRALKQEESELSRIDLAWKGWQSTTLYVPGKRSLLADWVFRQLSPPVKKRAEGVDPPDPDSHLQQPRHWALLDELLSSEDRSAVDSWLSPLISRGSIAITFLRVLSKLAHPQCSDILPSFLPVYRICLPRILQKASNDVVAGLLWDSLSSLAAMHGVDYNPLAVQVWSLSIEAFRSAFQSRSKRPRLKLFSDFVSTHLNNWLLALHRLPPVLGDLRALTLSAGMDVMTSDEAIRVLLKISDKQPVDFFGAVSDVLKTSTDPPGYELITPLLGPLFRSIYTSLQTSNITGEQIPEGKAASHARSGLAAVAFIRQWLEGPLALSESLSLLLDADMLQCRTSLLSVVETERIFDPTAEDMVAFIRKEFDLTLKALTIGSLRTHAVGSLAIIQRIEPDLVDKHISRILPHIAKCPAGTPAAETFLRDRLDFQRKTKSIDTHINADLECILGLDLTSETIYREVWSGSLFGAPYLGDLGHSVRTYLTPWQTPNVIRRLMVVFTHLWRSCDLPLDEIASDPSVDSDHSLVETIKRLTPQQAAFGMALLSRLTSLLLSRLPIDSLLDEDMVSVDRDIRWLQSTFLCSSTLTSLVSKVKRRTEKKPKSDKSLCVQLALLSVLRLGCGLRQLADDAHFLPGSSQRSDTPQDGLDVMTLAEILRCPLNPELELVIIQTIFHHTISRPLSFLDMHGDSSGVVTEIVAGILEKVVNTSDQRDQPGWDGSFDSPASTQAILLDTVLDRWLHVVESTASDAALERIASLIVGCARYLQHETKDRIVNSLSVGNIVSQCLSSAEFWDMRRIRAALLNVMLKTTAPAATLDISSVLVPSPHEQHRSTPLPAVELSKVQDMIHSFSLALYFPPEYLDKDTRRELVPRALSTDALIPHLVSSPSHTDVDTGLSWSIVLRTFISRVGPPASLIKYPGYTCYLTSCLRRPVHWQSYRHWEEYAQTTAELLGIIQSASVSSDPDVSKAVKYYIELGTFCQPPADWDLGDTTLLRTCSLDLLEKYMVRVKFRSSTSEVRTTLRELSEKLRSWTEPLINLMVKSRMNKLQKHTAAVKDLLVAWTAYLRYERWIITESDSGGRSSLQPAVVIMPCIVGLARSSATMSSADKVKVEEICVLYLGILLQEHRLLESPTQTEKQIGNILSAFILFGSLTTSQGNEESMIKSMNRTLADGVLRWPTNSYEIAIDLVCEHLRSGTHRKGEAPDYAPSLIAILRLSEILLLNNPKGLSETARPLLLECLSSLAREPLVRPPTKTQCCNASLYVAYETVKFLGIVTTEKASFIRDTEMGYILSLILTILSPSQDINLQLQTDPPPPIPSASALYGNITHLLTSLIRNVRSTMATHLADLTRILCVLLDSLKCYHSGTLVPINPNTIGITPSHRSSTLGTQVQLRVQASVPWWVSVPEGNTHNTGASDWRVLGEADARGLNRVLNALTVKTLPRFASGRKGGKQERSKALALEFNRHAYFVILAYVNAIIDHRNTGSAGNGVTTISKAMRQAIEEGMFDLCAMVTDQGRDWILNMLGEDGKVVFRDLWRRYDQQRHTAG